MKIILFAVLVPTALALTSFGTSYLGRSRLCKSWTCINTKLGLQDEMPTKERFTEVLRELLPENSWQEVVEPVVEICFGDRPRRYTNTCPGQAMLYCAVDNLIEKCPEEFLNKDDACAPPTSLAGFKFMFSQSRYEDFVKHLPFERRPAWFLKNYFNSKCCNLPPLFNASSLSECGFSAVMHYNVRPSQHAAQSVVSVENYKDFHVRENINKPENQQMEASGRSQKSIPELDVQKISDPLDCCDLTDFITRSSRLECDFKTSWNGLERLSIQDDPVVTTTPAVTVTTDRTEINDVKVVPLSCEANTCVFRRLQVIDDSGVVNAQAFIKLLDNMTNVHPEWNKAKARVLTKCLNRKVIEYDGGCEINKVLACTFDILSENCPFAKAKDNCRLSYTSDNSTMCQISSSRSRPKYRRQYCGLPSLVSHKLLTQCDLTSIYDMVYVTSYVPTPPKDKHWNMYRNSCKDITKSTKCLLNSMGVINKYGFLDYFKMKDRIRSYSTKNNTWSAFTDIHLNSFMTFPLYESYCNSPKKFLNVIDSMIMTCPTSKRRDNEYCKKVYNDIASMIPKKEGTNFLKKVLETSKDFHQIYYPDVMAIVNSTSPNAITDTEIEKQKEVSAKKLRPTPEFNFWLLNSNNVPPIKTITIKPPKLEDIKQPLTFLPVYTRYPYGNNENNGTYKYSNENKNVPIFEYQDAESKVTARTGSNEEIYRSPLGGFEYPQIP